MLIFYIICYVEIMNILDIAEKFFKNDIIILVYP